MLEHQDSFFKISHLLVSRLAEEPGPLTIQFMTTNNNFWSDLASTYSIKQIISLSIKRKNGEHFEKLPAPIDLYFKYKTSTNTKGIGITRHVAHLHGTEDKDSLVLVYKLEPLQFPGSGVIFVKFYNMSAHSFKVLLLENISPGYEMMSLHSKRVSLDSPLYRVKVENQTKDCINYLGILLDSNDTSNDRRPYSFEVKYVQCLSLFGSIWKSDGCYVGDETDDHLIHCQCWHLSIFGGSAAIAPREIDLQNDLKLLLDVMDTPKTFLVICSIILLYFIILVWTRHNDDKDRLQRYVIVLDDNFPGEEWAYLITVFTGFWIGSGTDANVGFRLYGTKGMSRIHNLQSHQRKVLKANCDDWFLIFTPKSLGDITKIHIFHDSTGPSPDWYCSKIMVYDLEGQKDFKFIVEKWLTISEEDEYLECFVKPTPTLKSLRRDRIAIDNVIFGLRETHLLISIFTRHPRSSVTRSQRLSICVCILMVHMLTSIMFYKLEDKEFPDYSSHKTKLIISMESMVLAAPFTFIVIFCFKKSRIVTVSKRDIPMTLTSTQAVPLESGLTANQSKGLGLPAKYFTSTDTVGKNSASTGTGSSFSFTSNMYSEEDEEEVEEEVEEEQIEEGCWKNCHQQIKALLFQVIVSKSIMPVKIAEEDEESSHGRIQWMYFAWILCETSIFVSALFIVVYSLKMDQKLCNEWMNDSLRTSFANIFIMAPIKIIIFATTLAVLYGQLQYIASYECNTESAMKMGLIGNEKFLKKVLQIRKNKCYHPLSNKETQIIRMQEKNWRRWRIIFNFIVILLLYMVLSFEILSTWDGLYIQSRNHFQNMFDPELNGHKITTFKGYREYLENVVIPALNNKHWYNGSTLMSEGIWKQELGFMKDYFTRIMGYPQIRQQRVNEDSCTVVPEMEYKFSQCNAPLTYTNMDRKEYSLRWTQPDKIATQSNRPWSFTESNSPPLLRGYYANHFYIPGGYTAKLEYSKKLSIKVLRDLSNSEWFDGLTRVVFFEMVAYNVHSNLISYITPTLEKLADGSFHCPILSTSLHPVSSSFVISLSFLLIFTFYYFFRIVLLFNYKGWVYLMSRTGLLDIFLNGLMYVTMLTLCLYDNARKAYIHQWHIREQEDLQMTSELFLYRDMLRYEMAILVIVIPAQLLHSFRFGKNNLIFFKTLGYCFSVTLGLLFIVIIYYIAFVLMDSINHTSSLFCPLSRCYSPISYFNFIDVYSPSSQFRLFTTIFCLITNIAAFCACLITIYSYRYTKVRFTHYDDFNMLIFILHKVKHFMKKLLKIRRRLTVYSEQRFRAGADEMFATSNDTFIIKNKTCSTTKQMCCDLQTKLDGILEKLQTLNTKDEQW